MRAYREPVIGVEADGQGHCAGLPTSPVVAAPIRCCVTADCPFNRTLWDRDSTA